MLGNKGGIVSIGRILIAFLAVAASVGGSVSATLPPPPESPEIVDENAVCVSCVWLVDDRTLSQLMQKTDRGDAEAAFRISLHFSSADNPQQYQAWARRAAELGHAIAQYNVWFSLRESAACPDRLEALAWLEKSAAQGAREATEKLQSFRQLAAQCQMPAEDSFKPAPQRHGD